ncbi:hypothetical protein ACOME3_004374 [Neoechinorhynchus agilis]
MQIIERRSHFMRMLLREAMNSYDPDCWNCAGPHSIDNVFLKNDLPVHILPKEAFYPFGFDEVSILLRIRPQDSPELNRRLQHVKKNSIAVHLYSHILRRMFIHGSWNRLIDVLANEFCPKTVEVHSHGNRF